MKYWKKVITLGSLFGSLITPLKAVDLEFLVKDSQTQVPLSGSNVALQGISDQDYFEIQETDDQGRTVFSVNDYQLFLYSCYNPNYHTDEGNAYSSSNETINVDLNPYEEGQWHDFFYQDGNLKVISQSFDPDVYYSGGESFNYEIEWSSISDQVISFTDEDMQSNAYDSFGNIIPGWLEPVDLDYNINLNPGQGWLKAEVNGTNITLSAGAVTGIVNGDSIPPGPDGESFELELQSNNYIVPQGLPSGEYYGESTLNYSVNGTLHNISASTQPFYVNTPNVSISHTNSTLERKLIIHPNPTNNVFQVKYYKDSELRIVNQLGQEVYKGYGKDFKINLNASGIYFGKIDGNSFKQTVIK